MSISAMYSLLLVAPTCFETAWALFKAESGAPAGSEVADMAIRLLSRLRRLVSSTQALPSLSLDGWEYIQEEGQDAGLLRVQSLQTLVSEYIKELDVLCMSSDKARKCLDKPNVHRLLELYSFSLPAFGTVHLIQELVLERGHQELKRGVLHSNFKNPQLQAMENTLANDWISRLGIELQDVDVDGVGWSMTTIRSVLRLLGRPEWQSTITSTVRKQVVRAFPPPVMRSIRSQNLSMSALLRTTYSWVTPRNGCDGHGCSRPDFRFRVQDLAEVESFLQTKAESELTMNRPLFAAVTSETTKIQRYPHAHWSVTYGHVHPTTARLSRLHVGDVVQKVTALPLGARQDPSRALVEDDVLDVTADSHLALWRVIAILGVVNSNGSQSRIYVAVIHCDVDREGFVVIPMTGIPRIILPLSRNTRRVMLMHKCSSECTMQVDSSVQHSVSRNGTDRYFVFRRREGYPPRSS